MLPIHSLLILRYNIQRGCRDEHAVAALRSFAPWCIQGARVMLLPGGLNALRALRSASISGGSKIDDERRA